MEKQKPKEEVIYQNILLATPKQVFNTAQRIADVIQEEDTHNQLLGIAAVLLCTLHNYNLSYIDVLGIADCVVDSEEFKSIKLMMKKEET